EVLPRQLGVLREGTDSLALATEVDLPGLADRKRDHGVLEGCISLSRRDLPVPVRGEQRLAGPELPEWNSLVSGGRRLREVALLRPARAHRDAVGRRLRVGGRIGDALAAQPRAGLPLTLGLRAAGESDPGQAGLLRRGRRGCERVERRRRFEPQLGEL